MNVLGLITARGGSKGIPGKNLAPCGGKPLLAWTCEAALGSIAITRTVISTDDEGIAAAAREMGVEAPFLRPPELASDTAKSIDVAIHAIDWLAMYARWNADVIVLLQPTSPLRVSRHIDEAYALLAPEADAVVSVVEVPHAFKPWSQLTLENGVLAEYIKGDLPFERYRRQGQPVMYARNGPAVIATRAAVIRSGTFYGEKCLPYVMTAEDSVDIDEPADLEHADWLLRKRQEKR